MVPKVVENIAFDCRLLVKDDHQNVECVHHELCFGFRRRVYDELLLFIIHLLLMHAFSSSCAYVTHQVVLLDLGGPLSNTISHGSDDMPQRRKSSPPFTHRSLQIQREATDRKTEPLPPHSDRKLA